MRSTGSLAAAGLLAFGLMGAAGGESLQASEDAAGRVRNGLLVLYDFASPDGDVVADRSGVGRALDLEIRKPEGVRRREGSLEVVSETLIRSPGNASKIADAVRLSGEITIELWIRPSPTEQSGPAGIVTMAPKSAQRNFTLGQDGGRLTIHFRTTRTGTGGSPSSSMLPHLPAELTHLVYTRSRTGRTRVFLNGERVMEEIVAGSTTGWERFPFALANELGGGRPWLGTFYLAAIYSRGLLPREVERNFRAGADSRTPAAADGERTPGEGDLFQTKIAPLFSSKCLECHNSSTKRGGFDLSHQAAALAGGASGTVLTPGDADGSRLIELIEAEAMPFGLPPLLEAEKALLREWVEGGAVWTLEEIVAAAPAGPQRVSKTWVQRLTAPEYVASVRSALGVDISREAAELAPPDPRADGFKNTAYNLNVDLGHVAAYARLAQIIVARMDVGKFAGKFADDREPAGERLAPLIAKMGRKILRAPLEEDELAMYEGLAGAIGDAGGEFEEVVGYLIEAMLQSPRFLYRIENQRGDGTAWPAGEYELASRLSYILWGAPPDEELMAAADAGELRDPAMVERHVERMLDDPRAVERSSRFIAEWLDLDRLDTLQPSKEKFPAWDPRLAADMRAETLAFFRDVVWKQKRPLADLLNAQFTYATPRLAAHYGLLPKGEGLVRYDLSATPSRGGLLTQGGVLTVGGDEASMVTRGLFVLGELLSSRVGNPPAGLDTTPPPTSPGRSHRAIAMERIESPACGGCHSKFEPLAFGLERFDGLGAYHEVDEHGNELREDGEILFPGQAKPVAYRSSAEMMDLLAASGRVRRTLTRKLTQFALGRPLAAEDEETMAKIDEAARHDGGTYASLVRAIVMSDLVQMTRTEREP